MNVIGLGSAGCAVADKFGEYPQYSIYKVGVNIEGDFDFIGKYGESGGKQPAVFNVEPQKSPEDYESNYSSMKSYLKGIKGDTLLVIGGSSAISAISLRMLQQMKNRREVDVLYIKPDTFLLDDSKKKHEKVTYNVLQQYARSGAIRSIYLISNPTIESILGEVPIMGYYDKLNELIVSTMHMINVYKNQKPVMGSLPTLSKDSTRRICTVGIFDIEKNEEKLFFSLDTTREKGYIYSISKERLQSESDLHKTITSQMKEKTQDESVNVSFGIFSTEYKNDYGYVLAHSPNIQS